MCSTLPRLMFALPCLLWFASSCGSQSPAIVGESCSPSRGCSEGLTCAAGTCQTSFVDAGSVGGSGAGGASAGGGGGGTSVGGGNSAGGGSGNCGPCNTPPTACHALAGHCVLGSCEYDFVEGATCDDGNPCTVADTCTGGACVGTAKTCTTPPTAQCVSSSSLKTYGSTGACSGGLCVYASTTVACGSGGCSGNACATDPCGSVTCDSPPSACFQATGTCSAGSCNYAYANGASCNDGNPCTDGDSCASGVCQGIPKSCTAPPADSCQDANTLKTYQHSGSCSAGSCGYTFSYVACPTGCANARCNGGGWKVMSSGISSSLLAVWGSSASAVWAAGENGSMLFYNGVQWQTRSFPTTAYTTSIHGTAANNVFAVTNLGLYYFDGVTWSLATADTYLMAPAVVAVGLREAWVTSWDTVSGTFDRRLNLWHITYNSGTQTFTSTLVSQTNRNGEATARSAIATLPNGDLAMSGRPLLRYKLDAGFSFFAPDAGQPSAASQVLVTGANQLLTLEVPTLSEGSQYVSVLNGSWSTYTVGGAINALAGTSFNRVFAVGGEAAHSRICFFDGTGWTTESIPSSATSYLQGAWAAPTGEVFAVGTSGLILKGP